MKGKLVSKPFTVDTENIPQSKKLKNEIKLLRSSLPTDREFALIEETSEEDSERVREFATAIRTRIAELERELNENATESKNRQATALSNSKALLRQSQDTMLVQWIEHEATALNRLAAIRAGSQATVAEKKALHDARAEEALKMRDHILQQRLAPLKQHIHEWSNRITTIDEQREAESYRRSHTVARSGIERRSTHAAIVFDKVKSSAGESSSKETMLHNRLLQGAKIRELFSEHRTRHASEFAHRYPVHTSEVRQQLAEYFMTKASKSDENVLVSRSRREMQTSRKSAELHSSISQRSTAAAARAQSVFEGATRKHEAKWESISHTFDVLRDQEKHQQQKIARDRLQHDTELSFRTNSAFSSTSGSLASTSAGIHAKSCDVADRLISRIVKAARLHNIPLAPSTSDNTQST